MDISTLPFLTRGLEAIHLIMDDNGWMEISHSLLSSRETVGLVTDSKYEKAHGTLGIRQPIPLSLQTMPPEKLTAMLPH